MLHKKKGAIVATPLLTVFPLSDTCETRSVGVCEDGYFNDSLGHVFIITAELLLLSLPMK